MSESGLNKGQIEEKTEDSIYKLLINLLACTF